MREKVKREVKHTKDDILDTYIDVLVFLMENKDKPYMKSEIGKYIFKDGYQSTEKNMLSRCIDRLIDTEILTLITQTINEEGKTIKLPKNQYKVRLYNKDIDAENSFYDAIDFKIPKGKTNEDRQKRRNLSKTLSLMLKGNIGDYSLTIYDNVVRNIMESNLFALQTNFASQTIGRVLLQHHHNKNVINEIEDFYSLCLLINIIHSKINIDITIENFGNIIELKNTKIKKISIKENGFDIHFDNFISQNQSNIKQIIKIKDSNEDTLLTDINRLKKTIEEIPSDEKKEFIQLIEETLPSLEIFQF
ncbi:hypothetical protein ACOJTA_05690 [Malaciobacter sp. WC5094]